MAKKIVLEQFTGVTPRVPNHALPKKAASSAVNARLTDSTIRPFYEPVDSSDTNSDLSANFDGYTNFFKASPEDAIAWLSWTVDAKVSALEVRYNDLDSYDYPVAPEATAADGHVLLIDIEGASPTVAILLENNLYGAAYTYTHTSNYAPSSAIDPQTNLTRQVTAAIDTLIGGATASIYLWEVIDAHADISIDSTSIASPTFTCSTLDAPSTAGSRTTKEATYKVTITDTSANTGAQWVKVSFTYSWAVPYYDGGRDDWCVWAESFLPMIGRAAEAKAGDTVIVLDETQEGTTNSDITAVVVAVEQCVMLTTVTGIELTCSVSTPLTIRGATGVGAKAVDALGVHVPVLDKGEFRWEPVVRVEAAGALEVAKISCHSQVYAAGNKEGRFILTHNIGEQEQKP